MKTTLFKIIGRHYTGIVAVLATAFLVTGCQTANDDPMAELAGLQERECRTTKTPGSKMRQSVCMSKSQWAAVDMANAESIVREEQTEEFLRRMEDYRATNPVDPGGRYNPYPSQ